MAQHKWAKEIHAWADGAEIEHRWETKEGWSAWTKLLVTTAMWTEQFHEYRIKPQPKKILDEIGEAEIKQMLDDIEYHQKRVEELEKIHKEPQYLYVYVDDDYKFATIKLQNVDWQYVGKIKLEDTENE